jgi:hypothetical protein
MQDRIFQDMNVRIVIPILAFNPKRGTVSCRPQQHKPSPSPTRSHDTGQNQSAKPNFKRKDYAAMKAGTLNNPRKIKTRTHVPLILLPLPP